MVDIAKIRFDVLELTKETRIWNSQREQYRGMKQEQFTEIMKIKFESLYTQSSTLFERCINGDLNMDQFNYMLNMLQKVNDGKDYQAVSQEVGQKLVDIYVKPLIEK